MASTPSVVLSWSEQILHFDLSQKALSARLRLKRATWKQLCIRKRLRCQQHPVFPVFYFVSIASDLYGQFSKIVIKNWCKSTDVANLLSLNVIFFTEKTLNVIRLYLFEKRNLNLKSKRNSHSFINSLANFYWFKRIYLHLFWIDAYH